MCKVDLSNETIIHEKNKSQEYIQFRRLLEYKDILTHCYSVGLETDFRTFRANREPLKMEEYVKNIKNYKTLLNEVNLDFTKLVKANQAHTDVIKIIDKYEKNDKIDTSESSDGLITNKKNIILATTNADCILFLFFDPVKKVIANIHSGWKGTLQEISIKTLMKMQEKFGCNPRDIIVCILPSIRKCHFEVDEDVKELFYDKFKKLGNTNRFIEEKNDKFFIDTVLINKILLMQKGILKENIEDSKICSVCNKEILHSFRAEGASYGLETALISLK